MSPERWKWRGTVPVGDWELALDPGAKPLFAGGEIEDILFIVTYSGRTPEWPAQGRPTRIVVGRKACRIQEETDGCSTRSGNTGAR